MKELVFIVILALFNITIGISYPNWCDTGVMILAEEEERSSEHAEDELSNQFSDYIILTDEIKYTPCPDALQKALASQVQPFLSPGMFNIHDIPPEA